MNKKWVQFYLFLIVILLFSSYFLSKIFLHPYVGSSVSIKGDEVIVDYIEPSTWAGKNLEIGDRIVSVDGKSPLSSSVISNWNLLEQVKKLTIERDGDILNLTVTYALDTQMVFQLIIPLIVLLLSVYCSFLIYRNYIKDSKNKKSALVLIFFLLFISLAYIGANASARGDEFTRYFIVFVFLAIPTIYLHFLYEYFNEMKSNWINGKLLKYLYALSPINVIAVLIADHFGDKIGLTPLLLRQIHLASFLIVFLVVGYQVVIGHRKVSYKTQKYLIKILLITNVIAFLPFVFLYLIPTILFNSPVFAPHVLSGFLVIIPFSLVYQFLATKIYDIEFIVGRLRYYSLIIAIPSVLCVIFMLVTPEANHPAVYSIRLFLVVFFSMFITMYCKEIMDFKFNLNVVSEKFNYQEQLLNYTKKIRVAKSIEEVNNHLKEVVKAGLLTEDIHTVVIDKDCFTNDQILNLEQNKFINEHEKNILSIKDKIGGIQEIRNGFLMNIGEAENKIYFLIALSNLNTPMLTRDEIQWLKALCYYTNVTLENFAKIEYLMENLEELGNKPNWLNKIVFNLEEKQRSELAKDLHDSVLQDLLSINRQLEVLSFKSKTEKNLSLSVELENVIGNMVNAIRTTRETCYQLRPQVLYDLGLVKALQKFEQTFNGTGINTTIKTVNISNDLSIDLQINIYRIIQELLNNAQKHANPKNIRILVVGIKDKIVVNYEDDGVGVDVSTIFNKEDSMGLNGIRERINMLEGKFEVNSEIGKGFHATIEILNVG
ncbi:histidine kinase [Metabacillus niabensis]|uniref:histidine kinase n=1 Tax=Metabacillus niabensis TaxID=324854 RepID=UPI0039A36BA4